MFYLYGQNNSGGGLVHDDMVDKYVIIEADDWREANDRAEKIGLYFDGEGDCPCCGDRWTDKWDESGTEEPERYGKKVTPHPPELLPDYNGWVHYKDGSKKAFRV